MRLAILVCVGFLIGCGGSGGGSNNGGGNQTFDFDGTWSGTWTGLSSPPPGSAGTLTITVSGDDVNGTVQNPLDGTGALSGHVNLTTRRFEGQIVYGIETQPIDGYFEKDINSLTGNLVVSSTRTLHEYLFRINLNKQ